MALEWRGATGNVIGRGSRGLYTIQSLSSGQHVLQAVDGEARGALPFLGETFADLDAAKAKAQEVDQS